MLVLVLPLLLGACAPTVTLQPGGPPESEAYRVAAPDVLAIRVGPEPGIVRELVIRPDGFISFDLVGDVEVEGKTIEEIRGDLTARLRDYLVAPDVSVGLTTSNSRKYFVFGEVGTKGAFPLIGRVTVLEAFGGAGGGTMFAALRSARLVRPTEEGGQVYAIDLYAITMRGDETTNYELQPDDVIYVPPNISARIGYALQVVFFPFQQILGLGGRLIQP